MSKILYSQIHLTQQSVKFHTKPGLFQSNADTFRKKKALVLLQVFKANVNNNSESQIRFHTQHLEEKETTKTTTTAYESNYLQ